MMCDKMLRYPAAYMAPVYVYIGDGGVSRKNKNKSLLSKRAGAYAN
jgi:hypothetical protein